MWNNRLFSSNTTRSKQLMNRTSQTLNVGNELSNNCLQYFDHAVLLNSKHLRCAECAQGWWRRKLPWNYQTGCTATYVYPALTDWVSSNLDTPCSRKLRLTKLLVYINLRPWVYISMFKKKIQDKNMGRKELVRRSKKQLNIQKRVAPKTELVHQLVLPLCRVDVPRRPEKFEDVTVKKTAR